jgi:hypothetical protein
LTQRSGLLLAGGGASATVSASPSSAAVTVPIIDVPILDRCRETPWSPRDAIVFATEPPPHAHDDAAQGLWRMAPATVACRSGNREVALEALDARSRDEPPGTGEGRIPG